MRTSVISEHTVLLKAHNKVNYVFHRIITSNSQLIFTNEYRYDSRLWKEFDMDLNSTETRRIFSLTVEVPYDGFK